MADYLPPVVARLSMDLGDFASGVAKAKALLKSLNGDLNIRTDGLDSAATKVAALSSSLKGLSGTVKVTTDGLGSVAAKTAAAAAATTAATGLMINGWRLTGNAIHWIVAGGAELLAVTLPALVALGAGVAVAAQGAQMVQQHMSAVYTATEATGKMFGVTAGQAVGMGNALQKAQNAANPSVYGILGSAITTVNEHFGNLASTGLQVVQMFQTFAAKVAVDFAPGGQLGGQMNQLLSHMTSDLQGIGQVFGNLGRILTGFASQMPGLAEIMLGGLSGFLGLAAKVIDFAGSFRVMGASVLTAAMAFEEFNRWGGLLAATLTRMGLASASLSGGAFSFQRFGSVVQGLLSVVPQLTARLSLLFEKIGAQGAADGLAKAATSMENLIAAITPLQALIGVGLAVGVGILVDKLLTARTAAQAFGDALQGAVMKTSNLMSFQQIAQNIAQLNTRLTAGAAAAAHFADGTQAQAARFQAARDAASAYNASLQQQQQDAANVAAGAALIARTYGTTFVGALALADAANVKLASGITGTGQAAQVAQMQIASLVRGYQAMGQPVGAVGADMTALAIQSGLASSQVGNLNSAWDQFQQNLTAGTSTLAGLATSLANVGIKVANFKENLGTASGISATVNQFAASLKNFGATGAAAWQNFDQIVGATAPQLMDWLRTAGAEGAASAAQFKQAGLDMASALVPLASQSATAQAEVMGLVQQFNPAIQTFSQLKAAISSSGASFGGLSGIVGSATQKMANMQSVAQTLGNVLNSALLSALSAATVQASGAGAAMQKYAQDLMSSGAAASGTQGAYNGVMRALENLGLSAQQAAGLIQQVTASLHNVPSNVSSTITVYTRYLTSGAAPASGINPGALPLPGHAAGTPAAAPGWAWVGEAGPELVRFKGGETVLPNSVSTGYAGGAGFEPVQQINVYLDGRQVYSAMQQRAVGTQKRTGHNGMQRRTR